MVALMLSLGPKRSCTFALFAALTLACGGNNPAGPSSSAGAASITLSPHFDTLRALQDTVQLAVRTVDASGTVVQTNAVEWSTSDTALVAVDASGRIVAKANGSALIAAAWKGTADTAHVVVEQRASRAAVSPRVDTVLFGGSSAQFHVSAVDSNGYNVTPAPAVTWSSYNSDIGTVDQTGLASPLGVGHVAILAQVGSIEGYGTLVVQWTGSNDSSVPGLDSLRVSPDTIHLSGPDSLLSLKAYVNDQGSGVQYVRYSFGEAGSSWSYGVYMSSDAGFEPVVGTALKGLWSYPLPAKKLNGAGTYTITLLGVADQAGNGITIFTSGLSSLSNRVEFVVVQ